MDAADNPYKILGVAATASEQEIRAAYRKLALKHHPDKQRTDEERQSAHVVFAKISNAYELLSDEQKRQEYDLSTNKSRFGTNAGGYNDFQQHNTFPGFPGFAGGFGGGHPFFHDPFQVFESVFREEFGGRPSPFSNFSHGHGRDGRMNRNGRPFHDPFGGFGDPMQDNFFGGGIFGGGLFGDMHRGRDPFGDMFGGFGGFGGFPDVRQNGNGQHLSYSSTSMSSNLGGRNGEAVTMKSSTKIINGVPQTVTERIVHKADGTVEREVMHNGQAIEQGIEIHPALDYESQYNEKKNGRRHSKNSLQQHDSRSKRKRNYIDLTKRDDREDA